MAKLNFHMGVTLRCYGSVVIEAESVEAALSLLTADYIGENITINETTTDSGQDLAVIDVTDAVTGEEMGEWDGLHLPSPYDPTPSALEQAAPDMLAALKESERWMVAELAGRLEVEPLARVRAAIAKAEPPAQPATSRPGDQAAAYAEENGVDYATALVRCNMD